MSSVILSKRAIARRRWHVTGLFGLGLTVFFIMLALLANWIAPHDPLRSVGQPFMEPSAEFYFGTDDLGRDLFSGVVYGARTSLLVGFSVATVSLLLGALIGGIAGFFGGWVDDLLMRLTELVQVLPRFFLALVVVALFGTSLTNLIAVLALTYWCSTARLMRSGVLATREVEYVIAARSIGQTRLKTLLKHVFPNTIAPVLIYVTLQVGRAILVEAGLSFIGLGDPNTISWGYLLNNAQPFIRRAWWLSLFPGTAIALTVLGVNLLGDGLRDWFDPRLR